MLHYYFNETLLTKDLIDTMLKYPKYEYVESIGWRVVNKIIISKDTDKIIFYADNGSEYTQKIFAYGCTDSDMTIYLKGKNPKLINLKEEQEINKQLNLDLLKTLT